MSVKLGSFPYHGTRASRGPRSESCHQPLYGYCSPYIVLASSPHVQVFEVELGPSASSLSILNAKLSTMQRAIKI